VKMAHRAATVQETDLTIDSLAGLER
jgi:hypothetical protein